MAKQLVQAVKGTRDFYPEQMAFRNWLCGKIKEISERFGYQEYDGPEIEYLELYADKTSQEILREQTFSLKDRDGKDLILRPELTPTFARMVAQKSGELPREIRWWSFGRTWRYEQPQKGRGREFFQWEVNILGPETPEADAEILVMAASYLKSLGLTPEEVVIKVSDREFIQNELKKLGIKEEDLMPALRIMDRRDKLTPAEFAEKLQKTGLSKQQIEVIETMLNSSDFERSPWLKRVFSILKTYGDISQYIKFDPSIIRGFDYYTRTVFEAWAKVGNFRALFGGGRFDNLTAQVGGARVPGVGFAAGDMIMEVFLESLGKKPSLTPRAAKVLVTVFNSELFTKSLEIANSLRDDGLSVELWAEPESKLDKQLKYADQKGIPYVIIIGPEEAEKDLLTLKDLKNELSPRSKEQGFEFLSRDNKTQSTLTLDEVIAKLSS